MTMIPDTKRVKDARALASRIEKSKDANVDLQSRAASFRRAEEDGRPLVVEAHARSLNHLSALLDEAGAGIPPGDEPLAPEPSSEDKGAQPAKEGQEIPPGDTPETSSPDTTAAATSTRGPGRPRKS